MQNSENMTTYVWEVCQNYSRLDSVEGQMGLKAREDTRRIAALWQQLSKQGSKCSSVIRFKTWARIVSVSCAEMFKNGLFFLIDIWW